MSDQDSDQDNIIPFRDPRRRPETALDRPDPVNPILDALKRTPRNREWYPVFASNLGEMARRLDQEKPLEAARRMFREAFGETADANWRKRKRYIRFEGEEASFDSHGDYVSNNEPYRLLADAFAKLHFAGDKDGLRKAHRMLVRGTSLNPRPTVSASQADGLGHALDCLRDLQSKCLADQEIASALQCLSLFPIAPFGPDENVVRGTDTDRMLVSKRGKGLSIVPTPTSTVAECAESNAPLNSWYVGRVLIGYLYFPQIISSVSLGNAENYIAQNNSEISDKAAFDRLNILIREQLEILKVLDFEIKDLCCNNINIPLPLQRTIHIRKPVYLRLFNSGKEPQLQLNISGEWFGFDDGFFEGCEIEHPEIFKLGATPFDDELIYQSDDLATFNSFNGVKTRFVNEEREREMWEWYLRVVVSDNDAHVVGGGNSRDYPTTSYSATVDDIEMRDALLEGAIRDQAFFKPMIWDDLRQLSAAPHGSIAATIVRNLAFAPEEQRIDTLLIKDARERLSGVVEFVRTELEKTNSSLDRRGIEF
jgi:hypothetical protein